MDKLIKLTNDNICDICGMEDNNLERSLEGENICMVCQCRILDLTMYAQDAIKRTENRREQVLANAI